MSELGQVVGSLLSSLAHARRIADEETALIAEHYRNQPLLEGMSLPRVRVPELTIELPVLIEEEEPGKPEVLEDPRVIRRGVNARFVEAVEKEGVKLSKTVLERFDKRLAEAFREGGITGDDGDRHTHLDVEQAVERAFQRILKSDLSQRLTRTQATAVSKAIVQEAAALAVKEPRVLPSVKVIVRTADIKDKTDPANVTRIKLVLREEGLEWTANMQDDGSVERTLTPE